MANQGGDDHDKRTNGPPSLYALCKAQRRRESLATKPEDFKKTQRLFGVKNTKRILNKAKEEREDHLTTFGGAMTLYHRKKELLADNIASGGSAVTTQLTPTEDETMRTFKGDVAMVDKLLKLFEQAIPAHKNDKSGDKSRDGKGKQVMDEDEKDD